MTSFSLNYLLKIVFPNTVILGVCGLQCMDFAGDTIQSIALIGPTSLASSLVLI